MGNIRRISAHYIITGTGDILNKGIIELDKKGTILNIIDTQGDLKESEGVEFYSGVISPGFINAHCHFELSHMLGKLKPGGGIINFIYQIIDQPQYTSQQINKAMDLALLEMKREGVVGVGDISNDTTSFDKKSQSSIFFNTFVEAISFNPETAKETFDFCKSVRDKAHALNLPATVVPHAPYSISPKLFDLIADEAKKSNGIVSIHNQETLPENELYQSKSGKMVGLLENHLGKGLETFEQTGKSSLCSYINHFDRSTRLLLIHNVFTSQSDIEYLLSVRDLDNTHLVLCPKSNLYIEDRLPDVAMFKKNGLSLCIGTDSLASNDKLSVLEELITLEEHVSDLTVQDLVEMATLHGAKAIGASERLGSIEVGKQPGINLIENLDLVNMKFGRKATVKALVS